MVFSETFYGQFQVISFREAVILPAGIPSPQLIRISLSH
jgi:hypothetical protein